MAPYPVTERAMVCEFGNKNGGCHEWTSSTNVGRAASIAVAEQIAGV